ncbi:MAG: hypothetical protein JKY23_06015 [Nitrospinaceae bacterium]|nr:hypothetical protein [Nitrospinaceae bacterium]
MRVWWWFVALWWGADATVCNTLTWRRPDQTNHTWDLTVTAQANASSVIVDGCVYPIPWTTPVLSVHPPCTFLLPVCGPGHNIKVRIRAEQRNVFLWSFVWDGWTCTGERADHGYWITWGDRVYTLPAPVHSGWVGFTLTWSNRTFTVTHGDTDRFVSMPWPFADPPVHVHCQLGPASAQTFVHRVTWDQTPPVEGLALLDYTDDPTNCALVPVGVPVDQGAWTRTRSSATLTLSLQDLLRCRDQSTQPLVRFTGVISVIHTPTVYLTVSTRHPYRMHPPPRQPDLWDPGTRRWRVCG